MSADEHFMSLALDQARQALLAKEVPVGCVFVKSIVGGEGTVGIDGNRGGHELLSTGFNATNATRNGTRHAEMVAIDDIILKQGHDPSVFRDCDLYVTCEPCIMCAGALSTLGVRRVYFGCHNDRFGGNGSVLDIHSHASSTHKYEITAGLMRDEAIGLFRQFYDGENDRAPDAKRKRKRGGNEN